MRSPRRSCDTSWESRMSQSDYLTYRGKCKELSELECSKNPSLRLTRGHYYCPIWNSDEPHWWCVDEHGTVVDPSAKQFPSRGSGIYTEFDGRIECAECGKTVSEESARFEGNYAFCSDRCIIKFVGL